MFQNKTDSSMYNHAKMGRIQDLKKKLYAMIAQDPKAAGEDDVLDHNVHGLGQPTRKASDHAQPMDEESMEGEDMNGDGMVDEDDMDPMAQMAREFKPKSKPRRAGTAMLIATALKSPSSKGNHSFGNKGKHKGGF